MGNVSPFEHFLSVYVVPIVSAITMIGVVVTAFSNAKLDARLHRFKDDIMAAINGKYLHSDVADVKFKGLDDKLNTLQDIMLDKRSAKN